MRRREGQLSLYRRLRVLELPVVLYRVLVPSGRSPGTPCTSGPPFRYQAAIAGSGCPGGDSLVHAKPGLERQGRLEGGLDAA